MLNLNGHSLFSPSSSAMWLNCSGSLLANMQARIDNGEDNSSYAAEGTMAHELAEIWLKSGKKPIELIGEVRNVGGFDIEITEEMLGYVGDYVNWCNDQEGDKYVEVKVDFSHLTPVEAQRGTSDHVNCADKKLTITDLKYGMGVKVYAEDNTQMQIYALGVYSEFNALYDFETVEMRICQPRLNHFDSWEIPVEQLLAFGEFVKERALEAIKPDAKRTPSEKACQWCKVRASCPAKAAELEAMVDDVFSEPDSEAKETMQRIDNNEFLVDFPKVETLSVKQMEKILEKAKTVKQFLDDVEKYLFEIALKGGKLEQWKLVNGRKTRKWISDAETEQYLISLGLELDDVMPRELVSVAAAEKLIKGKGLSADLAAYVADRTGAPTLAPMSDKRAAYAPDNGIEW